MKKLISIPVYALFGSLILFSSCKKDSTTNRTGSGNLDAGKAAIALTSSTSFGGSTTFDVGNTLTTTAVTQTSSSLRNISLACNDVSGTNTRSVMIMIITPADASTTSGSLTGDLSLPNGATILPTISMFTTNAGTPGPTYSSESGTLTITKLTATEVEGTFSGTMKDVNGSGTFTVSNGTFAGKF